MKSSSMMHKIVLAALAASPYFVSLASAQTQYKMTTPLPPQILTPASVETRIGKLEYVDGVPTPATAQLVYDNLDFQRGIEAFLNGIPGASLVAMRAGMRAFGPSNSTVAIAETLSDSRTLLLTANTESVYFFAWLDLKDGPIVVEGPPDVLGVIDDFWFRYVADFGNAGPDKGKGGKYLVVPPGYKGELPKSGYYIVKSETYGNLLVGRGFLKNGSPAPTVASIKARLRIYPYAARNNPPKTNFVNSSGVPINTIHANDLSFYDEVNQIVQEEPAGAYGPDMTGVFRAIGIEKGKPFAPDARMKRILTDAVAVGNATARAFDFANRDPAARIYPDRQWNTPFIGGSYQWLDNGARNFDARTMFFYAATVDTPAMAVAMPGIGSQYASVNLDSAGKPFDGGKNYVLHVPPKVPVKDFWSVVVYDTQTRSMLQTDQQFPSVSSQRNMVQNADGSYDVYFGPKAPAGKEANWIQTLPGKSWFTIFRLYGPLQAWFDKSWKLNDIVESGQR
ncbi:signal peptide protein [Pandoraea captiosa]|uniref:Signal peptide protein n=2 Tax=Pandoraea captiosa TaxID=2508302 RepID=A0A5E4ZWG6_9BURK|nr:signal peptide protein [Pandoraea captiosa]